MSERRRHALIAWIFAEAAATIHAAEQRGFRTGTGRIIDRNREKIAGTGSISVITQSCPDPRSGSDTHVEIAWRRLGAGRLACAALNDPVIGSQGARSGGSRR
jgi:hypothetical protein